jgi:hypothetical protein
MCTWERIGSASCHYAEYDFIGILGAHERTWVRTTPCTSRSA